MNFLEPVRQHASDMPMLQTNAHVSGEFVMRVGIPHTSGKLAFHAFNNDYAAMVSAGAFWNPKQEKFRIPDATDLTELAFALDSAGFTAMLLFKEMRQRGRALSKHDLQSATPERGDWIVGQEKWTLSGATQTSRRGRA